MRVVVLISGGGTNLQAIIDGQQNGSLPIEITAVISNKPDVKGLQRAETANIATAVVDHRPYGADRAAFADALTQALIPHRVDVICLAGFMRVLTAGFVGQWNGRMLNIHPSLLPLYKGLHTHARALAAGDRIHGCTVHEVTPALDDGPILGQARVPVLPDDTPDSLAARVLIQEHRLYPAVLKRFYLGNRDFLAQS